MEQVAAAVQISTSIVYKKKYLKETVDLKKSMQSMVQHVEKRPISCRLVFISFE